MHNIPTSGQFCWIDVKTRDIDTTKAFYSSLFGWYFEEVPTEGRHYTKIRRGDSDIGGISSLNTPFFPADIPPHISVYIAVADVEQSLAVVESAGGKVLLEAFEVAPLGRMATIQDPTGAVLSLWQGATLRGMSHTPQTEGTPTLFELLTSDESRAKAFYAALFGWQQAHETPTVWLHEGQPVARLCPLSLDMLSAGSHWRVYFTVVNSAATLRDAESLGARVIDTESTAAFIGPDALTCFLQVP